MSYDSWKLDNGETAESMARNRAGEAAEGRVAAAMPAGVLDEVNVEEFCDDGCPLLSVRLNCLYVAGNGGEAEALADALESIAGGLRGVAKRVAFTEDDAVSALAALRTMVKKADAALATGEWPGRAGCAAFRAETAAAVRRIEAALGNL